MIKSIGLRRILRPYATIRSQDASLRWLYKRLNERFDLLCDTRRQLRVMKAAYQEVKQDLDGSLGLLHDIRQCHAEDRVRVYNKGFAAGRADALKGGAE